MTPPCSSSSENAGAFASPASSSSSTTSTSDTSPSLCRNTTTTNSTTCSTRSKNNDHQVVVLFYKYFIPPSSSSSSSSFSNAVICLHRHADYYLPQLQKHQRTVCTEWGMRGRILLSAEGINGTLSASNMTVMTNYIKLMQRFDLVRELGYPPPSSSSSSSLSSCSSRAGERDAKSQIVANHEKECLRGDNTTDDTRVTPDIDQNGNSNPNHDVDGADDSSLLLFADIDWKLSKALVGRTDASLDNADASQQQQQQQQGEDPRVDLFPDLKVSIVKEIVSTGGIIHVTDIPTWGGKHLSPEEFHAALRHDGTVENGQDERDKEKQAREEEEEEEGKMTNGQRKKKGEVVLIDVRNTFEHAIGHFVHPETNRPALNPDTVTFSSFDSTFCTEANIDYLRDKKVLMYCTGGIRCEKASAMLTRHGVRDVNQLRGGIHRYLERFGADGFFVGKNFVFDRRVALPPESHRFRDDVMEGGTENNDDEVNSASDEREQRENETDENVVVVTSSGSITNNKNNTSTTTVGKCLECNAPYDEISGSRICTVCRDLVLVCPPCRNKCREYHCIKHSSWKNCYYTFLDVFDEMELEEHKRELHSIHKSLVPAVKYKNTRRTLMKQIRKVENRIKMLQSGEGVVNKNAKRQCRTCMETEDVCDGLCWGFWKESGKKERTKVNCIDACNIGDNGRLEGDGGKNSTEMNSMDTKPVAVGDRVEPGLDWNTIRLGSKLNESDTMKQGTVVEIKSWGSGGNGNDCVAVCWDREGVAAVADGGGGSSGLLAGSQQPQIYRWGVAAKNGQRMYDVQKIAT